MGITALKRRSILAATVLAASFALPGVQDALAAPTPGRIAIAVNLEADAAGAARTWRFEVADSNGAVVRSVSIPLSGEAPSVAMAIDDLPSGDYEVRPVLSSDLGLECANGALFRVSSGAAPVPVGPGGTGASFTITPCGASASSAILASVPSNDPIREIDAPSASYASGTGDSTINTTRNMAILAGSLTVLTVAFATLRSGVLRRRVPARNR